MPWIEAVKLSGAFAVPLVAVAGLFYGIMRASLGNLHTEVGNLHTEVRSLGEAVHALDVRLARLEERIPPRP